MKEIVERDENNHGKLGLEKKAIDHFKKLASLVKLKLLKSIPEGEEVSIYFHGKWHDLCEGHICLQLENWKIFKLTKVSGAYWRGDSNNENASEGIWHKLVNSKRFGRLFKRIEEAEKKRDHRKLGKINEPFFIFEKKVLELFFGTKKDGHYFKNLFHI